MRQIVEDVLAGRDVDLHVAPFLGRNLREASPPQRFGGRDDLDDGGVARVEVAIDGGEQRRRLHRRDEVVEEALLGALERRARGGLRMTVQGAAFARDVRGLERRGQIVVNDLEGAGIGVVDADLLRAERSEERRVGKEWVSTCSYRWPRYH